MHLTIAQVIPPHRWLDKWGNGQNTLGSEGRAIESDRVGGAFRGYLSNRTYDRIGQLQDHA